MSVASEERPGPDRSPFRKKKFLNPLSFLNRNSHNMVGSYDYFSDDDSSNSLDDLPLGIHGRGWSYDFDSDQDSDDSDDNVKTSLRRAPSPTYAQIHFHTTFDDEKSADSAQMPRPCARERHLSALPRPPSPPFNNHSYAPNYISRQKVPQQQRDLNYPTRAYEADSDTSGTVDTDDEYDDPTYTLPKERTIRFADEEGYELQTIYITERDKDEDEHLYHMRFIVLLLNPKKKQFEFLHLTTPREERTHLSQVIALLSHLASDPSFTKQKYAGLCRPLKDGQELINSLCLQDYDLDRDEILVAIPSGVKVKDIVTISQPLLKDRNVHKMVSLFLLLLHSYFVNLSHMSLAFESLRYDGK